MKLKKSETKMEKKASPPATKKEAPKKAAAAPKVCNVPVYPRLLLV